MEEEKRENLFLVSIVGENIFFEVPVNSANDLENVENILKTLKKKL